MQTAEAKNPSSSMRIKKLLLTFIFVRVKVNRVDIRYKIATVNIRYKRLSFYLSARSCRAVFSVQSN